MSGKVVLCMLGTVVVLSLVGYGIFYNKSYGVDGLTTTNKKCSFKFINPLRCEPEQLAKKREYQVLKNELTDYLEDEKKKQMVTSASVYFRDLQGGPIMSINDDENFTPASLMKLPILISFYKQAEDDPSLLKKRITAPMNIPALPQNIKPDKVVEKGRTYTIDELLTILITQSDNTAGQMLIAYLQKNYPDEDLFYTLSELGIIDPRKDADEQYVTVSTYAAIFRMLYNASYLNMEMSNKALTLLTDSVFKDGIVAGLPSNIKVAHKFGERKKDGEQQLHDCGLVYLPQNPYLLCIMAKGTNTGDLEKVISHISRTVFDEVKKRSE